MASNIWDDERITAYVLGELQGDDRVRFEKELKQNRVLQEAVSQAEIVMREVRSVIQVDSQSGLSPGRKLAVAKAIQAEIAPSQGPSVGQATSPAAGIETRGWGQWLSMAAMFFVLATLGLVLFVSNPRRVATTATSEKKEPTEDATKNAEVPPSDPQRLQEQMKSRMAKTQSDPLGVEDEKGTKRSLQRESPPAPSGEVPPAQVDQDVSRMRVANAPAAPAPLAKGSPAPAPVPAPAPTPLSDAAPAEVLSPSTTSEMSIAANGRAARRSVQDSTAVTPLSSAIEAKDSLGDSRQPGDKSLRDEAHSRGIAPMPSSPRAEAELDREQNTYSLSQKGKGPGQAGDRYALIEDNPFLRVNEAPLSTFSVDVDTASYAKVRQYLTEANQLPRPDAVRIEELVNYFDYEYAPPTSDAKHPFAVYTDIAPCPWNKDHFLARIAIKGKEIKQERPRSNLVFLIDVSGSMNQPNKLPLVQRGLRLLLGQLNERDRVAIVVYAGAAGMVLDSTPADLQEKIHSAIDRLQAGGSTNGGEGIRLAYKIAQENFIEGATNRVILCSDGDFNVGTTGTDELVRLVEQEAKSKIFLTVLGFGMGNHNDEMLEKISDRGNGNYGFIDTVAEARKVLVRQLTGTLITIAKDVKLQIEFNPRKIGGYRLIGYENRVLAAQDFNDDKKDAGEIGAGHEVTAFYELVPAGVEVKDVPPPVDPLRYQNAAKPSDSASEKEWFAVKLRYKQPEGDTSTLIEMAATEVSDGFASMNEDFRFAAAVAGFGMQLRQSPHRGNWEYGDVLKVAKEAQGNDRGGLRIEFLELVNQAMRLSGTTSGKKE